MRYKVTHTTTYEYNENVPVCQNEAHLVPRDHPGQTCRYHRLVVKPTPTTSSRRVDYFGNPVNYFVVQEGHRRLVVTSICRVDLAPRPLPEPQQSPPWELVRDNLAKDITPQGLANYQFCFDSPHVRRLEELGRYAGPSFPAGRPILAGLLDLTQRIFRDFKYDPTATNISTPVEEVFRLKRGVCQDLAHVAIGCLRSLGLAARYVSGYLRTYPVGDKPKLLGADASHAWISLYCGDRGWIDADPTNNCLPTWDHITVAWGRDFSDVSPINGMFIGGGQHSMSVAVSVIPTDRDVNTA